MNIPSDPDDIDDQFVDEPKQQQVQIVKHEPRVDTDSDIDYGLEEEEEEGIDREFDSLRDMGEPLDLQRY